MSTPANAPLKRFVIFGYDMYYPCGGDGDQEATFETEDEVRSYLKDTKLQCDHWDVLDMKERRWRDAYLMVKGE